MYKRQHIHVHALKRNPLSTDKAMKITRFQDDPEVETFREFKITVTGMLKNPEGRVDIHSERGI